MLIREDVKIELIEKCENTEWLQSLSDDELKQLYASAEDLRMFFGRMQIITKELCNSVYGGFGTASLRYFNQAVASDITAEGRWACQLMEKVSKKYFLDVWANDVEWHKKLINEFPQLFQNGLFAKPIIKDVVVTCDTDSNYLTFDYVFESLGIEYRKLDSQLASDFIVFFMKNKMDPMFDNVLTTAISKRNGKSTMIFELETVGEFGIFVAKKKYAFKLLWKDGKYIGDQHKLKVTGLELVQKSMPQVAKNAIRTFIDVIFVNKGVLSSEKFYAMCTAFKRKVEQIGPAEFSKNTSLNKYEDYVIDDKDSIKLRSKCPFAVRGAANYNFLLNKHGLQSKYPHLRSGMRAKTYYDMNGQPFSFPNDEDFPHEFAPPMSIDIQVEKLVFSPVKRLVSGGMIEGNLNRMGQKKMLTGFSSMFKK